MDEPDTHFSNVALLPHQRDLGACASVATAIRAPAREMLAAAGNTTGYSGGTLGGRRWRRVLMEDLRGFSGEMLH